MILFLTIPHYVIGNFGRQINFLPIIPRYRYIQYIFILIAFSFNKNCLLEIEIIFKAIAMNDKCIECVAVLLLGGPKSGTNKFYKCKWWVIIVSRIELKGINLNMAIFSVFLYNKGEKIH